jgi:hypothetical protein
MQGEEGKIGAGEGIRTLDPDLGKVGAGPLAIEKPRQIKLYTFYAGPSAAVVNN